MNGELQVLEDILSKENSYTIPPYQRQYQWDQERWQSLISDISKLSLITKENSIPHWMGVLLISKIGNLDFPGQTQKKSYEIVDGQQRIATLIIWIAALVHHAENAGQNIDFDLKNLVNINFQISDKKPIEIVLAKRWLTRQASMYEDSQIIKAYSYFRYLLWLGNDALIEEYPIKQPSIKQANSLESVEENWNKFLQSQSGSIIPRGTTVDCSELLKTTLKKLCIFTIIHEPEKDEPVASVFDTLNGMRTELEPLDHVRNSLFVRLGSDKGLEVYTNFWSEAEERITDVRLRGTKPGVSFLYDFVISQGEKKRQGSISRLRGSSHFSKMTKDLMGEKLVEYIKQELLPAMHVWPVVIRKRDFVHFDGQTINFTPETLQYLDGIQDLSKNPANPLVMLYCAAYIQGKLSLKDLNQSLQIIESYLGRLVLSLTPLSPLRAKLMDISADIDKDFSLDKLKIALNNCGWASDSKIIQTSKKAPYGELDARQVGAILRSAEKTLSGKHYLYFKISSTQYSIEHIFPRKDEKWLKDLKLWGTDSKKMQLHLNLLGNLTAVSKEHNSKVGNKRLNDKQKYPSEIGAVAPLKIHSDWLHSAKWTEKEIQKRTEKLINYALKNWNIPS